MNDEVSWQVATAERSFLLRLGGGCSSAIAALAQVTNGSIHLEALVGGLRSGKIIRTALTGSTETPEELGRLVAERILGMGGAELIEEVQTPAS